MNERPLTTEYEDIQTPSGITVRKPKAKSSPFRRRMRTQLVMASVVAMMERMGLTRAPKVAKGLGKTFKRKQWEKLKKARKVAKASRKRNRR